jgi:predicted HTH domain antitoxin
MQPIKIEIELPEEVAKYVDYKNTDYHRKARELLLYQLVRDEKISFGKAAEILGMRKIDYITRLGSMGIPYLDGNYDEVSSDIENLNKLSGEQGV